MEIKEQCGIIIRNNNKKWNLKCYRCQKRGYIAIKCRMMSIMKNECQNANITMHEKDAYYVFIGDVMALYSLALTITILIIRIQQ